MRAAFLMAAIFASALALDALWAADPPSQPEVLSGSQILSVLPGPLPGWMVAESGGSTYPGAGPGFAYTQAYREYRRSTDYDSPAVQISIMANGSKVAWVHDLDKPQLDERTPEGFRRTVMIDGYRVSESFRKATGDYSLNGDIDRRFLFTISSQTEKTEALEDWFRRTDWKKLVKLQPAVEPAAPPARRASVDELRARATASAAAKKLVIAQTPAQATREKPYQNSFGMRFVPVPGTKVLFSILETRVKEFQAFVTASGRTWEQPSFKQTEEYPAVLVRWGDAAEFCQWLTKRERETGKLGPTQIYRLPTDREWSVAVGIPGEGTGPERFRSVSYTKWGFPWGKEWPRPGNVGNYAGVFPEEVRTSPVGLFQPNQYGIFDLGGNVMEWCEDWENFYNPDKPTQKILRGASWVESSKEDLFAAARKTEAPQTYSEWIGFRCVLAEEVNP
jgi:formylglycine-generating enzyme required for sulfatase activity